MMNRRKGCQLLNEIKNASLPTRFDPFPGRAHDCELIYFRKTILLPI